MWEQWLDRIVFGLGGAAALRGGSALSTGYLLWGVIGLGAAALCVALCTPQRALRASDKAYGALVWHVDAGNVPAVSCPLCESVFMMPGHPWYPNPTIGDEYHG